MLLDQTQVDYAPVYYTTTSGVNTVYYTTHVVTNNSTFKQYDYYRLIITRSAYYVAANQYASGAMNCAEIRLWQTDIVTSAYPLFNNHLTPSMTNTYNLGKAGTTWANLYVQNSPTVGSDLRLKKDISTCLFGLDFIKQLQPKSYKFIVGKRDQVDVQIGSDENGNPIYQKDWVDVPGTRTHCGFIAQEIQQLIQNMNIDYAGWVLGDVNDPDSSQYVRYEEFIAPLVKGLQELVGQVETLQQNNTDLESRLAAVEAKLA